MRVWSRGLGRVELAADLKKVKIFMDGERLFIVGRSEHEEVVRYLRIRHLDMGRAPGTAGR